MNEMANRRNTGMGVSVNKGISNGLLDGYYMPGPERKHKSPTKRLIQLKNSTWDHKTKIKNTIAKGDYSQTYCISPGKSYVIEPQGGELNYDIANKKPKEFYDQVLHQDMKKFTVKMRGDIKGEFT